MQGKAMQGKAMQGWALLASTGRGVTGGQVGPVDRACRQCRESFCDQSDCAHGRPAHARSRSAVVDHGALPGRLAGILFSSPVMSALGRIVLPAETFCLPTRRKGYTVTATEKAVTGERADLLESLAKHRYFLRYTVRDLTDEQAAQRTTASELCLGGLIKHVALTEAHWVSFIVEGPSAMAPPDEDGLADWSEGHRMLAGETLAGLLEKYEQVARRTDELVATLPDLDLSHPLPEAPWFEPGARWSARRVLLHVMAETAQHAGHADIIRESLDGAKSMA
jgi:Protein of unknown function (DUF664)